LLEPQVRKRAVFGSRAREERLVPVDADDGSIAANRLRDTRGNGAGAATDIEDGKPRTEESGEEAVVPL
jgi:hypothetical protein